VAAPASAGDDENYKVSEGLAVYIGLLPAALIKGHPTTHTEATMHGGVPSDARKYHLVIAVFDAASGDRVENAKVAATVSGLGHVAERSFELEPMRIEGSITYGAFFDRRDPDRYDIKVDVAGPGRPPGTSVSR
jgi:hypothetical protein